MSGEQHLVNTYAMNGSRLCLVIPSLQVGGMERVMSELAGYLDTKRAIEVHLLLYGITREIFYPVPDRVLIHKPEFEFNNRHRLVSTWKTLLFLRRTVKKIDPQCILSFGEYWNSFVILALLGLSFPIYISDRCSPEKKFSRFHTFLRNILYPRTNGIIVQTENARQIYEDKFRKATVTVIGNPIRQIGSGVKVRENVILSVGRLIKSKNFDRLIQLFESLNRPDWKLVIIGGDALKQDVSANLHELIRSRGLETRVVLAGYQSDIDGYYMKSGIFALASESEGFPNVIGEAMSAGLPVVAFDCVAGPSEMITDGLNGYLIPLNDYTLFRDRLLQLIDDRSLCERLGTQARIDIQKFSVGEIGARYLKTIFPG